MQDMVIFIFCFCLFLQFPLLCGWIHFAKMRWVFFCFCYWFFQTQQKFHPVKLTSLNKTQHQQTTRAKNNTKRNKKCFIFGEFLFLVKRYIRKFFFTERSPSDHRAITQDIPHFLAYCLLFIIIMINIYIYIYMAI